MKKLNEKLNHILSYIDACHLEWACIVVVFIIMLPILILKKGAVFPILDQLDETILNYVFPAKYIGADVYEQMMCGVPSTSLKPFAPGFVLLYMLFPVFTAFLLQYLIVILIAAIGTYLCVKRLTNSSISAFLAGAVFALLPYRSIYGLSLCGTPFLIACILFLYDGLNEKKKLKTVLSVSGIVFYGLFSSLVLVGYAALTILFLVFAFRSIKLKKTDKALLISGIVLFLTYALTNIDLISQLFFGGEFVSHREEYVISGFDFFGTFRGIMINGIQHYDSFHKYIYIPIVFALPFLVIDIVKKGKLWKVYIAAAVLMVLTGLLYAFFAADFTADFRNNMTGMLKTFQAQRFYWLLVGGWYVSLGISLAIIWEHIKDRSAICGLILIMLLYLPTLIYVAKNPDCIFYQNVNQINNGSDITGYISWESYYGEDQLEKIEKDIGRDMSKYKIAHLATPPAPSLLHGFYTIDGYSNDYPLSYKHEFAKIIEKELSKNDVISDYFYNWGNRCYLFYSGFGDAYMLGKNTDATISGMEFDLNKMRELGCEYIFSGVCITDADTLGITLLNTYEDDVSFRKLWVYEISLSQ